MGSAIPGQKILERRRRFCERLSSMFALLPSSLNATGTSCSEGLGVLRSLGMRIFVRAAALKAMRQMTLLMSNVSSSILRSLALPRPPPPPLPPPPPPLPPLPQPCSTHRPSLPLRSTPLPRARCLPLLLLRLPPPSCSSHHHHHPRHHHHHHPRAPPQCRALQPPKTMSSMWTRL